MSIDNEKMISKLKDSKVLKSKLLIYALENIDRADFVRDQYKKEAYEDHSLPIGFGATISQPTTVVFMLEHLDLKCGQKVLDVGSGSGWTSALIAHVVGKEGKIYGVERIKELVDFGKTNVKKYSHNNIDISISKKELGLEKHAPYDRILVSASSDQIQEELIKQLRVGGVMVIPVENSILKVIKKPKGIEVEKFYGFVFIPLIND